MELQSFQDFFGTPHHNIERASAFFRFCEAEHLHFIELVHTDQPALMRASRARLPTEAGGIGEICKWHNSSAGMISSQMKAVQDTSAVGIR